MIGRRILGLALLVCGPTVMAEVILATPPLVELAAADMPDGVTLTLDDIGDAQRLRIENTNTAPVSVILSEVPVDGLSNTRIEYEAQMAAEGVDGKAYLELWAIAKGQAYFSRALNDVFVGNDPERRTSTPFFLKATDTIDAARLGVRLEGPGVVTLRDVRLLERPMTSGLSSPGALAGITGSLFGVGSALYSVVVVVLAWKGLARRAVLTTTLGLAAACGVLCLAGALLWMQGAAMLAWYMPALLGIIGAVNFGSAYGVLRWWYRRIEDRRMTAMDMA